MVVVCDMVVMLVVVCDMVGWLIKWVNVVMLLTLVVVLVGV